MRRKNGFRKLTVYVFTVLLLISVLMSASCGSDRGAGLSTDPVKSSQTADIDYSRWYALAARSGSTLFFLNRTSMANYLLYADTEAGVSGYLCGKPECTHIDENCDAWLGNMASNLLIYDGHIYWVIIDHNKNATMWLYRMEMDGKKHERVMQLTFSLNDDEELYPTGNTTLQMHQGILYVSGTDQRLKDGELSGYSQVTAYDISTGQYESVYRGENHPETWEYGFNSQCNGDFVWYLEYFIGSSESDEASYLHIYRYHISEKRTETVYEGVYPDTESVISEIYTNWEGLWFITQENLHTGLWQFDLQDKQPVLKYTIEYEAAAWMTDGLLALYSLPDEEHIRIVFVDFSGKIVSDQSFPKDSIGIRTFRAAGFDKEQLCLLYDDNESKTAFVLIPTDGGDMQILWHEKR